MYRIYISLFCFLQLLSFAETSNNKLLIFTKTAGFRHDSIADGVKALKSMTENNSYLTDHSEDSSVFTDKNLKQYRAIIFLSTTGDILNNDQQLAFQRFIQAGGGFVGIHAASDTEYDWPWYMRLIGAQFSSHPQVQNATQEKCNCEHEAIDFLPQKWTRKDEWYNFKNISPHITVLLTLDESTYTGGKNNKSHPSSWCQKYDGGRMFYTAGGHTKESYKEELFLQHILGGINYVCTASKPNYTKTLPDDENFEVSELAVGLQDPIAIAVSAKDEIFIIERKGAIKLQRSGRIEKIHQLNAIHKDIAPKAAELIAKECGGLGISLDPDFQDNHFIYIYYSPKNKSCNRLSRFTFSDDKLIDEVAILDVDTDRTHQTCHEGGSLAFANNRELYITTGDNTNPFTSQGASPINETPGNKYYDAQRSAGNSNDLRGSILRIIVNLDGSYSIPKGNLYTPGTAKTRPEIYIKGCRNPYKMSVDKKNNLIYWGEVGPDASNKTHRGPMGYDELNQASQAAYFGWPYFVGDQAYNDLDFSTAKSGQSFSKKLINDSPNNTGLSSLPKVNFPILHYPYKKMESHPDLGNGSRNAMAGPVYHQEGRINSFPAYFDDTLFFYDWCRSKILLVKFNEHKKIKSLTPFMESHKFIHPIDIQQGPKGDLYVLTYGSGWWNNSDGTLQKISFEGFNRRPTLVMQADKNDGKIPLRIHFSSEGTMDKDGDSLSYAWSFGDGRISKQKNPQITYTKTGLYQASLTVSDTAGRSSTQSMKIIAGNERPKIHLDFKSKPSAFIWGETFEYTLTASDAEDGVIDPALVDVTAEYRPDTSIPKKASQSDNTDPRLKGMNALHQGTKLIEKNNCLACHQSQAKSIGPSYADIAKKYVDNAKNRETLLKKLKLGGNGVWGHMPMPPQSHIADIQLKSMISAIMAMGKQSKLISKGENGKIRFMAKPSEAKNSHGIYVIRASYRDQGANGLPALVGESKAIILESTIVVEGGKAILNTDRALIHGINARKEGSSNIGFYRNIDTSVTWNTYIKDPGVYEVYIYQACAADKAGSKFELHLGSQQLKGTIVATSDWTDFTPVKLGSVNFPNRGSQRVHFKPKHIPHGDLGNIKGIILKKM
ncbi:ThuA domain-containing protein [Lentisphaera profundi]|uniref:ThuA domain-containing protein n=1 Tax=Lentisphaera profundi TaxID=1658616 RepID=A0ABY7VR99_9BACT|nr:ThuA domain-containing protein [Lentisphaera profundi]WDE95381.1 ThuA domain-containing protein [Lentisphaera profundi]